MKLLVGLAPFLVALSVYANYESDNCRKSLPMTIENETLAVAIAFAGAQISPDVLPEPPRDYLSVSFETATVEMGNKIFPTRTILPPGINYDNVNASLLYTFLTTDLDVPSRVAPRLRNYLTTLYVNVDSSLNLDTGFRVAPWIPPSPTIGSGPHRFVTLLFEQTGPINFRNRSLINLGIYRYRFNITEFAANYTLGVPVAGNFWQSEIPENYEEYCPVAPPIQCNPDKKYKS